MDILLSTAEARALDQRAEQQYGLSVELLMEHAGRSVAEAAAPLCASGRAVIFAGPGNNGGDGFVAARHLAAAGLRVEVVLVTEVGKLAGAAKLNHDRWLHFAGLKAVASALPVLAKGDLAIDALLGTGLGRPPEGAIAEAIRHLNAAQDAGARVVAVDLPSGLDSDTGQTPGGCVAADLTVTFGARKRGLAQEPGATLAGALRVGSLGLPPDAAAGLGAKAYLLDLGDVVALFKGRSASGFKNDFGHVVAVAGSPGKSGAATLVLASALRSGAGLVTLAGRKEMLVPALAGHPEAMSHALEGDGPLATADVPDLLKLLAGKQALAIGPGLWRGDQTAAALRALLAGFTGSTVLDADALNAVAEQPEILQSAHGQTVITPHPGEMARLLGYGPGGSKQVQSDRFAHAADFAREHRTVVVLKGAKTIVASPLGELAVVPTGNAGLAHGGTGDVLCGLIGGLLAQGLSAFDAARAGAYLHGLAGDRLRATHGERGIAAGDVADALPALWAELEL